jgi:hypothetical protein
MFINGRRLISFGEIKTSCWRAQCRQPAYLSPPWYYTNRKKHVQFPQSPYESSKAEHKSSVISFLVGNIHHLDMGTLLDRLGIAVRTGHHCAQPLMIRMGIEGTVRASFYLNINNTIPRRAALVMNAAPYFYIVLPVTPNTLFSEVIKILQWMSRMLQV